ncbi:uncharacterized protein LTR77_010606 [Saxophila tyrrhenica]|uniref:Ferric reductase NAD binding domain-containing protein n=1 Tax=Saxophila tyrrhenica TaxID=1690608 RepID=A0AAV9NV64_9PEZI|nr:hypothetical protein LTR77_010606 [Saxophila tyrrhenica]
MAVASFHAVFGSGSWEENTASYLYRSAQIAALAGKSTVPVILTGPYGIGYPRCETENLLAVAGGTGSTFTLPIIHEALHQPFVSNVVVDFVWIIRQSADLLWLATELTELNDLLNTHPGLRMTIFITRKASQPPPRPNEKPPTTNVSPATASSSSTQIDLHATTADRFNITFVTNHHPSIPSIVQDFAKRSTIAGGNVEILDSVPRAMGSDLRSAVADVRTEEGVGFIRIRGGRIP